MRLIDMVLRFFRPKFSSASAPVFQERQGWSFDHVPSYSRANEEVRDRIQKQRTRPKRDRKASDACVARYLAARREELFHRPARAA